MSAAVRPADDEIAERSGQASKKKGGGSKKILFIIAPVLALAIVGAGLWFSGLLKPYLGGGEHGEEAETAAAAADHGAKPAEHGAKSASSSKGGKEGGAKKSAFFDLPDILVNLNTPGRKTSFLKMAVSIELEKAEDAPKLQAVMPRVIDSFQVYLRELRIEDLKGSSGMYRLREELLMRVNSASPVKIVDILFKEMLVQ